MPIERLTELQYTGGDDLFPVLVYEYNKDHKYGPPLRMSTLEQLNIWIKLNLRKILDEKRELRITDTGDMMCFHVNNGEILYDGVKHYPE